MSRLPMAFAALAAVLMCAACTSPGDGDGGTASPTASPTATSPATSEPTEEPTEGPAAEDPATEDPAEEPSATEAPVEPDGRQTATVVVTSVAWNAGASAVEASAYVPVVEDDGLCTLTLVAGTTTVTVDSVGYPDAASTSCDLLTIPGSDLRPGTWQATVTYLSEATRASAQTLTIEVP